MNRSKAPLATAPALFFALFFLVFAPSSAAFAEGPFLRVVETAGRAEISEVLRPEWRPLTAPFLLREGDRIRTAEKSHVEISFDKDFLGVARLGADSVLEVRVTEPVWFVLKKGSFFLLQEYEEVRAPVTIATPQLVSRMDQGACFLETSEKGTRVKVFGEALKVRRLGTGSSPAIESLVEEGFGVFSGDLDSRGVFRLSRLVYDDYTDWQGWFKKSMERRDDRARDLL